jgi:hypothetical protein
VDPETDVEADTMADPDADTDADVDNAARIPGVDPEADTDTAVDNAAIIDNAQYGLQLWTKVGSLQPLATRSARLLAFIC